MMNKSTQTFGGLGIVLLVLAIYALLPPSVRQLFRPTTTVISTQGNSEPQGLNVWEGKPQQLVADSKKQSAAKSSQTDSTVRNPTNVDAENSTTFRASKEFGQDAPSAEDDSRQKVGSSQSSQTSASEKHSSAHHSRGPPSSQHEQAPRSDDGQQYQGQTETLLHGLLQEISKDHYLSPAGLIYGPGSAEGHRLDHLGRHIKDQPNRPGKHGVFDGGMQGALKTIDDAFKRAQKNQRTTKTIDRNRTIYTVDLGKRVGFVGGQDGRRRRNPMARRVRLVLEGKRVITAYPM
jgi:hypothetical protein